MKREKERRREREKRERDVLESEYLVKKRSSFPDPI
jgi:hypothetical protein